MWCSSGLGRQMLRGAHPRSIEELRTMLPLTSYADYADVLLPKRMEMLCDEPSVWIQTTWWADCDPSSSPSIPVACWTLIATT